MHSKVTAMANNTSQDSIAHKSNAPNTNSFHTKFIVVGQTQECHTLLTVHRTNALDSRQLLEVCIAF